MFRREGSTNLNAFKTRLVEQEKKMEIYRPVDLPQQWFGSLKKNKLLHWIS